ncbi:SDR family oxidoreductase [Rhizorhabdus phycosphaerae]|uniref:SDR family oxidoreductase n=1 Tax=Rhizorhabdus phycosphaerae TaxID=2711156 RepID=UPI0013EB1CCD|nr:SDR family oxidoreductase [Rhizorhabdus phycosphaerae]
MKFGLEGKSVLVMAGSQGIGLASAQGFHQLGARVTIAARGVAALDEALALMPGAIAVRADVTDPSGIADAVAAAGAVDVLVNNAGGPPAGLFDALDDSAWQSAVDLTLMSAVRATRAVLPHMRAQRWGRIVNISSYGVKQPVPNLTLSNAIRMAVLGWAKTLADQVGPDNVTVNTVCPGWTRTARVTSLFEKQSRESGVGQDALSRDLETQIPLRRIGEPEEIANMVVFLGSEAASYITGAAIQVDGGIVKGYA